METKRTHFKMYKSGRRWVFACAVMLAVGVPATVVHADSSSSTATQSAVISSSSSSENSSSSSSSSDSNSSSADSSSDSSRNSSSTDQQSSTESSSKTDATNESNATKSTSAAQTTETSTANTTDTDDSADTTTNQATTTSDSDATTTTTDDHAGIAKASLDVTDEDSTSDDSATDSSTDSSTEATAASTAATAATTAAVEPEADSDIQSGGSVYDDFPNIDDDNLLGISSVFHIFAREAELNAHTNGNLAVQYLTGNVNFGTNIIEELLDKDISYIQNINNIANSSFVSSGDTRYNKVIFGQNVTIDISDPNRPTVNGVSIDHLLASEIFQDQNGQTYIDFDAEFAKLREKNKTFAELPSVKDYTSADFSDQNNRVIDVSDMTPDENGRIVINLSPEVLQSGTPLTIKGVSPDADGDTIIINVDTGGEDDYTITSQIKVIYSDGTERDNKETEDFGDNHLLWNFVDRTADDLQYTGTIHVDRPFQGSMLAPSATIEANQNIDGNIIADKVIVNAETHRWDLQDNQTSETDDEDDNDEDDNDEDNTGDEDNNEGEDDTDEDEDDPQIAVPLPGIDVEMPSTEEPGTEAPDEEEELTYEHQHEDDDDIVEDFEEEWAADESVAQEKETLNDLQTAIAKAKAEGDTALAAKLEALEQKFLAALGRGTGTGNGTGVGTGLPQTGEAPNNWAQLLGLALASGLAGGWFRRKKHQQD